MQLTFGELKRMIAGRLMEAQGALKMLNVVECRLILTKDMKIEEIITGIRVIKGVATVNQTAPVRRTPNGSRILEVLITFDPQDLDLLEYIDAMAQVTKKIAAVTTVVIKTLNGDPVRDATGKRKLVY